jgi:hypothetical protein
MSNGFELQRIRVPAPAVPANGATVTLMDSTVHMKGGLAMMGIGRVHISFPKLDQASAAGGLIGYTSEDDGATWDAFAFSVGGSGGLPATVAAATASDYSAYDIFVDTAEDVKFTFTAGATAPSAAGWKPNLYYQAGNVRSGA